jgi:hypothetical protein
MEKIGWFHAFASKSSIDRQDRPIPWVAYPFLRFIEPKLRTEFAIFEFGCGNSTLYYASRVKCVDAVEHDPLWFEKIRLAVPSNVSLVLKNADGSGAYSGAALTPGRKYDLIIVDGKERVACLNSSLGALSAGGVVILDDSERTEYEPGVATIVAAGFRRLDFWGISPGCLDEKSTTVFYRSANCLGI